ncbi:V-type ATP synthase subunit E [Thermococcus cleftensis]|uniref:A-type ATP synthase subunit E n=1 Tax=Thermococcus cleftensis (strain DSM 27260 / KACC 17922 / CL1) TaxID=163003 RepID=I3ZTV3_THECF|nr:V-type ATP synthase subunit E [Thermococcus cleftensis]AFL95137.1 V-type ATP synthase subunit E [Thermococcus cleftensis]
MEGAELIIQEINREAEQKIQYILSEAREEAEQIKEEARKRAEARAEWIMRKAQTQAEIERQRIIANARLEVRKKRLQVQEELIQEVISALRERLAELPEEEYFPMLIDLAVGAVKELGSESFVLRSNEKTLELLSNRLDEFRKALAERLGKDVEVALGEPVQTIGGLIVETPDGSVRVDNTFEARIERFEGELRAEIAKALFG